MGGGSSKSKVEAGPRMNYRKQGTGVSALSRLDSNTIVDKLRLHRKNIPEDLNDGMKETDFVQFMAHGIQRRYDTSSINAFKRADSKKSNSVQGALARPVNFQWEEVRELGRGSFGSVVLGKKVKTGQLMAVKKLCINDKQASADAMTEITLLSNMKQNPFIVNLTGYQEKNDIMYIFMEYVEGGSIESQLQKYRKDGQVMEKLVSKYTYQILKGLSFLHQNKVIHGDVKCANILTDRMGCCKLADFGSAQKVVGSAESKKIFGSVCWMAPEIIKQTGFDLRSDIWSLGATVFEMLTSYPPFFEKSANQWTIMHKIAGTDELPYLGDNISSIAKDFVYTCMKRNPSERPSAKELLEHPFVLRYSKNLDADGNEIEPIESLAKQSPEDEMKATLLLKQGKELRSLDIKQEIMNNKTTSGGSRSSIKVKNEGFQLSVQTAESKGANFFGNSKPTTPSNLHMGSVIIKTQDLKPLDNEKYINIDTPLKLSANHSKHERIKFRAEDRVFFNDHLKQKDLPRLRDIIQEKKPSLPIYASNLASIFKSLGKQDAKKPAEDSVLKPQGEIGSALMNLMKDSKKKKLNTDALNVSTFNRGYNTLDDSLAILEKPDLDGEREGSVDADGNERFLDEAMLKPRGSFLRVNDIGDRQDSQNYL